MDPGRIQDKPPPAPPREDSSRESATSKRQPSMFDQVVQQARVAPALPSMSPETKQQSGEQGTQDKQRERERERTRTQRRDGTRTKHESDHENKNVESGSSRGVTHVAVKAATKREGDKQQGEQHGQGAGGGRGGFSPKEQAKVADKIAKSKADVGRAVAAAPLHDAGVEVAGPQGLHAEQMQRLVNLLVQSIQLGKTAVGGDELLVALHASIFKGLRLRLQTRAGKVAVIFESDDAGVRKLFSREGRRIQRALEARGVAVDSVAVVV